MTLDEIPTEKLNATGATITRIVGDLGKAADEIETKSGDLADLNKQVTEKKDKIATKEAEKRGPICTANNKETNRLLYQNLDAQNAAVILALQEDKDYLSDKDTLLNLIVAVEKLKARIVRLHEKRRDLNAEREMIQTLSSL